jgi:protein PhnA
MAKGRDEHEARKNEVSSFGKDLVKRSKSCCELCTENTSLGIYEIAPVPADPDIEKCVMICDVCREQLEDAKTINVNHWHCLNETAWSEVPAIQVLAWRMLTQLTDQPWAQDLKDQLFLEEDILEWAEDDGTSGSGSKTVDSNGTILQEGDSVHIIKDLEVKGAGFTAKRGTIVKNVHLVANPEHIEGRVNKTKIVLKTCFLKKA